MSAISAAFRIAVVVLLGIPTATAQSRTIVVPVVPGIERSDALHAPGAFVVDVGQNGTLAIDGRTVSDVELMTAMRDRLDGQPPDRQCVFVRADAAAAFRGPRKVINLVRAVGFDIVMFVVSGEAMAGTPPNSGTLEAKAWSPIGTTIEPSDRVPALPPRVEPEGPKPVPPPPPPASTGAPRATQMPAVDDARDVVFVEPRSAKEGQRFVAVNGRDIAVDELARTMGNYFGPRFGSGSVVALKARPEVPYADVIALLEEIRAVGIGTTMLVIDDVTVPTTAPTFPLPTGVPGGVPGGGTGAVEGAADGGGPGGVPEPVPPSARLSTARLLQLAIEKPQPVIPPGTSRAGIEGIVVVEVIVGRDGRVESAKVLGGHPLLSAAAIQTALKWTFRPSVRKNGPIRVAGTLTFTFRAPK